MTNTPKRAPRPHGRLIGFLVILLVAMLPGSVLATPVAPPNCFGADANLSTEFTDIRRDTDITVGPDLGDGGNTAMNFKGSTGSAGDLWMSLYTGGNGYSTVSLCVDVLTHPFNNRKGAGVFFLYTGGAGNNGYGAIGKGLAAIVTNAGNTDTLILGIADSTTGAFTPLAGGTYSLGAAIAQDAWYRLWVGVSTSSGPSLNVNLLVYRHTDPTDPYSPIGTQVGSNFNWNGALPAGIATYGDVGLIAYAKLAVVDSSAIRFNKDVPA